VGHVFESTDGGTSWRDLTGNLPDAPVYKVAIRGRQLVVGTEVGSFVSRGNRTQASGLRWARLGRGLPDVTVWDLTVAPDGRVVAGTHGRGDWEVLPRR
jgi:sugar lactone lactonase YvrE